MSAAAVARAAAATAVAGPVPAPQQALPTRPISSRARAGARQTPEPLGDDVGYVATVVVGSLVGGELASCRSHSRRALSASTTPRRRLAPSLSRMFAQIKAGSQWIPLADRPDPFFAALLVVLPPVLFAVAKRRGGQPTEDDEGL